MGTSLSWNPLLWGPNPSLGTQPQSGENPNWSGHPPWLRNLRLRTSSVWTLLTVWRPSVSLIIILGLRDLFNSESFTAKLSPLTTTDSNAICAQKALQRKYLTLVALRKYQLFSGWCLYCWGRKNFGHRGNKSTPRFRRGRQEASCKKAVCPAA